MSRTRWLGPVVTHTISAFLLLGTVAGTYWAAVQFAVEWIFWILWPLALAYGVVRAFGPAAVKWVRRLVIRIREYDRVSLSAARAIAERDDLCRRLREAEHSIIDMCEQAVRTGRERVIGEMLAVESEARLDPLVFLVEEAQLVLVARLEDGAVPPVGSRFFLRVVTRPSIKAAVVVADVAAEQRNVALRIDEVMDGDYVDSLRTRVAGGTTEPPPGLEIFARSIIDDITDLEREVGH